MNLGSLNLQIIALLWEAAAELCMHCCTERPRVNVNGAVWHPSTETGSQPCQAAHVWSLNGVLAELRKHT